MTKTDKQILQEFREQFGHMKPEWFNPCEQFILAATAKTRAATIEEVRKSFVHIAIGGKDTRDELKGLELYTKTLKMLDKLKTEQGEEK